MRDNSVLELNKLKDLSDHQKELRKDELSGVRYAMQGKEAPAKKKPLLNLNIEALVTMGYQDKLKRDRIGIIFKRAKKNAWDRPEKNEQQSSGE